MTRHLLAGLALSLLSLSALAQNGSEPALKDFYVETRFAHESEFLDGENLASGTGFKGQWLNLRLDGNISDRLSYSWRHRLSKPTAATFLDATDWAHIDYMASPSLTLSAGKQVVAIGGFEYDRAPIDLYYCSEFWNNIPCYQIGVSASWSPAEKDNFTFQLCNTPYRGWNAQSKVAANILWSGTHGFWQTLWSANLIQTADAPMSYVSLGNRFNFTDNMHLDLDIMSRSDTDDFSIVDDMTFITEFSARFNDSVTTFAKYSRDFNVGVTGDRLVVSGTDISMVSAGVEFMPLEKNRHLLKVFAVCGYRFGDNANPYGTSLDGQALIQLGIKWRMEILGAIRK